jgi:hypothetical protein
MKVYIIHHAPLVERRVILESELKRVGLDDVEWVTTFPPEHPLIQKVRDLTGTRIPNGYISINLKHYDAMSRMVRDNIPEALIFEDDVIFSEFFDVSKIPREFSYVKLGKGVDDMGLTLGDKPIIIGNNGGAEACYMKRLFARDFIENIDIMWTIETEEHAYLFNNQIPLVCVPMCYQKFISSVSEPKDYGITWVQYIRNYSTSKKFSFGKLKNMFDI